MIFVYFDNNYCEHAPTDVPPRKAIYHGYIFMYTSISIYIYVSTPFAAAERRMDRSL